MIKFLINFFRTNIWLIPLQEQKPFKAFALNKLRIIVLAFKNFFQDECQLRASALTFYSLLSIVPLLALLFGIAKGFGLEQVLEKQILEKLHGQEEVLEKILTFAKAALEQTQGGIIAGIGVMLLIWSSVKLLNNIGQAFNAIWSVQKPRTISRKVTDYLSLLLICPILIIVSSSLTVLISSKLAFILNYLSVLHPFFARFDFLVYFIIKLLPYITLWLLFSFIYIFIPHTKVNFRSALIGAIIAGTLFHLLQWGLIKFQINLSNYGAIYGSFSALPLFLIWLQLSWLIILFGAQVSFAIQNVQNYEFEPVCDQLSVRKRQIISICILKKIASAFEKNQAMTAAELARDLNLPVKITNESLFELNEAKLISEITYDDTQTAYQLALPIKELKLLRCLERIQLRGLNDINFPNDQFAKEIEAALQGLLDENQESKHNFNLIKL